jgi:hypothetical protein
MPAKESLESHKKPQPHREARKTVRLPYCLFPDLEANFDQRPARGPLEFFSKSRIPQEERKIDEQKDDAPDLTPEYVSWVRLAMDEKKFRRCCTNFFRRRTIDEFRHLSSVKTEQLFVDSLEAPEDVSLVIFKGIDVAKVVPVSSEALETMGWKRDHPKERYWRYCHGFGVNMGRGWVPGVAGLNVFKVQMDGEIIGICTSEGYIPWEESFLASAKS